MMGRAARNERRKLQATFFNSIAIGFFLGGVFVPYAAAMPKLSAFVHWMKNGRPIDADTVGYVLGVIGSMIVAGFGSWLFRRTAERVISRIEGD